MAANIPMATNGQMMMQQRQQLQQQHATMQQRQLSQMVYQQLANNHGQAGPNGWQAATTIQDRLGKTTNLYVQTLAEAVFFVAQPLAGRLVDPGAASRLEKLIFSLESRTSFSPCHRRTGRKPHRMGWMQRGQRF